VSDYDTQTAEVGRHLEGGVLVAGGAFAAHAVHNVTPFIEHRRQMKVPHPSHG
jgi:hypothetical protein